MLLSLYITLKRKEEKMTASYFYLIYIISTVFRGEMVSNNELLMMFSVLVAFGIISICSRLDDLKRK